MKIMIEFVAITGTDSSKTPYITKNAQPIVFTILNRLMSFIKKDNKIPNEPIYPITSVTENPMFFELVN
jgi:hypothetical protein